jgi:DNA-damage-inducible protein D
MDKRIKATQAGFEKIKHVENGIEYWSARELMPLLEYVTWRMFEKSIARAMTAAKESGAEVDEHFVGADKMLQIGKNAQREITDYHLTRYACYLIAQNGDPRKTAIALAQTYFAAQTRKQEIGEQRKKELERLSARHKLRETEQRFSGVVMDRDVDQKGIAEIRGAGDQALFGGHNTTAMKQRLGVKTAKPLADYLPTVTLKAKDLAAEMTTVNTLEKDLKSKDPIKHEHVDNNQAIRHALGERGIRPEQLPPAEDTAKLERRINKHGKLE